MASVAGVPVRGLYGLDHVTREIAYMALNVGDCSHCDVIYSVSQKQTSPTFLAVTRESIVGFS